MSSVFRRLRRWREKRRFRHEFEEFRRLGAASMGGPSRFALEWSDHKACLHDRTPTTEFDRHYVYFTAWAARILVATRPPRHVDISSFVPFVGMMSAFVPIEFYDIRPAPLTLPNLSCGRADLTHLPFDDGSIPSLSCLHVVEHVGLGRYGDPLDPDGDVKAMAELTRVLAPGGSFLFVTPTGRPRIEFNAHRIYAYRQVLEGFSRLRLASFALIPDHPASVGLVEDAPESMADAQAYGCGCYWFKKPA